MKIKGYFTQHFKSQPKEPIMRSFSQIVNMVENDLEYGFSNKKRIPYKNEEKLNKFTYNIEKTGIRCYNIDNLIQKSITTKSKTDNPNSYGKNIYNMMQLFGITNPSDYEGAFLGQVTTMSGTASDGAVSPLPLFPLFQ